MPVKYYKDSYQYPFTEKAVLETLIFYMASLLYPDEPYSESKKRMIRSDFVNAGDDQAIRRNIDEFKANQAKLPFTAYCIDENEVSSETMSNYQESGNYYCPEINCYVLSTPIRFTFPMMCFFSTAEDYWRAKFILQDAISGPIGAERIYVPMTFKLDDTANPETFTVVFPANIGAEVTKGSLAFAFEEHLRVGGIYNIFCNITVQSTFIKLNRLRTYMNTDGTINQGELIPYPVDEIYLNLKGITTGNYEEAITLDTVQSYDSPEILSTAPTNNETDFDVDSPVIITFSGSMNESSVVNNMDIVPFFSHNLAWNQTSTQLVIDPIDALERNTEYNIVIGTQATSMYDQPLEEEFSLTFTTEV